MMKIVTFFEVDQRAQFSSCSTSNLLLQSPIVPERPALFHSILSEPHFCTHLSLNLPFIPFPLSSLFGRLGDEGQK